MQQPTTIIILGITGDLAQKKILPALYDLYIKKELPEKTQIVGFSRKPETPTPDFGSNFTYVQGDFDAPESYTKLAAHLQKLDEKFHDGCSNKLFYLSVPPTLYETIATHLSASGLTVPCNDTEGYTRVLVEKPFGSNLETAEKLDLLFGTLFTEEQIYRIDHYLAKQSLIDIIDLHRKSENVREKWNNNYIEKVEINLFEKALVGSRGAFYDKVGALCDVGQNHMLQMLALIAMDIPVEKSEKAQDIQQARAAVLQKLKLLSEKEMSEIKKGQYAGYLSEPGVTLGSTTETFFSLTAYVDTPEFAGVPFVLTSGKALDRNLTEIKVIFKDKKTLVFTALPEHSMPAYQKILLDCIIGDQTVFTSTQEILAEWRFITPIVEHWRERQPVVYEAGSDSKNI